MKAQITQINTDENCHCERPKGAWQSHTKCHPELDSGSQMLKLIQHDKLRNFYE
jgi:hypothetical protein